MGFGQSFLGRFALLAASARVAVTTHILGRFSCRILSEERLCTCEGSSENQDMERYGFGGTGTYDHGD